MTGTADADFVVASEREDWHHRKNLRRWRGVACNAREPGSCKQLPSKSRGRFLTPMGPLQAGEGLLRKQRKPRQFA
jgi:hypothetical protein